MRLILAAGALAALLPLAAAKADPIVLFDDFVTADVGVAAPVGADPSLKGPLGLVGGLIAGPITVIAPTHGKLLVTVADQGYVGDVFQVFADGAVLGTTSPEPVGGATNSSGSFSLAVTGGAHTIDLWDYILSFIGGNSPYGGAVDATFSPADVSVTVSYVPEPGSAALLGLGLAALCAAGFGGRATRRI